MAPEGEGGGSGGGSGDGGSGGGGGGSGADKGGGGSGSDKGGGSGSTKSQQPEVFSREYVHELREENKATRLKLQQTEAEKADALKQSEAATTGAADKIKEVNTAADQRVIRAELKAAALKAGMIDLDGLKLADLSKVKLNDKGEIEGAEALMEDLKKTKPYLFGTQSTSSTHKPPPADKTEPKNAKDMTKEEYAAARKGLGRGAR